MKNNTLLQTNLLVCIIIALGFMLTSIISYQSNFEIYQRDVEIVSELSSEGLYNEISSIFSKPVSVSLTMANDSLLKTFLTEEQNHLTDEAWQDMMKKYLSAYQTKYEYDSVFLVSTNTSNYYHFEGLDRVLTKTNPENNWYYDFLVANEEYSLNVDNDEATDNSITVFVNCKIKDDSGIILGIVGVGLQVNSLQTLLSSYEEQYGVQVYMVNNSGIVEISSSLTGHEKTNFFDIIGYANNKHDILENRDTQKSFWYSSQSSRGYVVTQYEPNLRWHLVVENDTSAVSRHFNMQLLRNILIIILIVVLVLIIITTVIRRYNIQISELTISQELEYQRLLHEMTEGLYENIFELNITRNCACGESTREYFESLGVSADTPYDKVLLIIAGRQIKAEYIRAYIDTFSTNAVLEAYKNGISNLSYDFMLTDDEEHYRWIRLTARVFYWDSDKSVRMITYKKNIDTEKTHELRLLEGIQKDSMTGLYNKRATEALITDVLTVEVEADAPNHAFLIFDIDNFKTINDSMGHSAGDHVINELAAAIKAQFRENDIVGRIGGDEFAVLMKNIDDFDRLKQKLARLCIRIENKDFGEGRNLHISCSIGVALFPQHGKAYSELYEKADQALYYAKSHGKNSFCIFGEYVDNYSFHTNQRDMETLMNSASDGLAQYACTNPLKLLYFNQKCVEFFGIPSEILSAPNYNPLEEIHPDDAERVIAELNTAAHERKAFTGAFRIRHQKGYYIAVQVKGIFINELYNNEFPVFYAMYIRQENT